MARKGDAIYKRGKVWRLDCFINGQRYQLPLGKGITRSVAAEIATIKRGGILKGLAGIGGRRKKDISFDDAASEFLKWIEANKRSNTLKSCRTHIKQLLESFIGKTLREITPFLIEKHKIRRLSDGCPVALNRELSYLKLLFNCFRKWKKFDGENPVSGIKGPKESEGRTRILTEEEEGRLLGAAEEPLRTMIICGIATGVRMQAEGLTLRRENIDLKGGYLTVEAAYAKNNETETIPLNSRVLEALRAHLARTQGDYVFTDRRDQPFKSIRRIFEAACRRANLSGITPHVLRHTFASRLGDAGVSDGDIQALGRWKDAKMIKRYKHLTEKHLRESVEKIAKNIPTIFTTSQVSKTRKSLSAHKSRPYGI